MEREDAVWLMVDDEALEMGGEREEPGEPLLIVDFRWSWNANSHYQKRKKKNANSQSCGLIFNILDGLIQSTAVIPRKQGTRVMSDGTRHHRCIIRD